MPVVTWIFFAALAGMAFYAIRYHLRKARERRELQIKHPGEPWMWRADWADRAVRDEQSIRGGFLWVFGFLWILMSLPVALAMWATQERDRVLLIFVAIFPIVGVLVLISAAYQTLRRRKYGVSLCRLNRLPVPLGSTFRGEVQARVHSMPEHGFQIRLTNVRREERRTGKSRSVRETVLWQDEQTVGSGAAMPHPDGMRIPLQFAIPLDAEATDDTNPRDSILWRLEVRADVPGIDYIARFALPVYRVEGAPEADYFPVHNVPAWTPPPYVAFQQTRSGGEEVIVKPVAGFGDWFGYLFFIALWYAALGFALHLGMPLWVVVFFGLFGALVMLAAADLLAGRSIISADQQALRSRRGLFGIGPTRTFPAGDVEDIVPHIGKTTGNIARYNVEAQFRDGKRRSIAKNLMSRRDADGVAERIKRALGR
ncbi:MAG TPA: hypothetical protein VKB93_26405 [Thermoanaerobaculia bacterium]|nr:hypothetical protein [Thermoanaerobaculia bacterium]